MKLELDTAEENWYNYRCRFDLDLLTLQSATISQPPV